MARVLLVVPCFNEATRLRGDDFLRASLPGHQLAFHFVDDGSTDGTSELLASLAVRERATHTPIANHKFVGRRLVGGQTRQGETIQLSYPYPRPGTEAVFEDPRHKHGGFAQTSTVTRVVLRLHMITVTPQALTPTWAEITRNTGGMPAIKP